MSIVWKEVTYKQQEYLPAALELYDASFPAEVREPHEVFRTGLRLGGSVPSPFHVLAGLAEGRLVAFIAGHYLREVNVGFVVYIAVDPTYHGSGAGTAALQQLERTVEQDARQAGFQQLGGMVLEAEKLELMHSEAERAECERRYRFFAKNGYEPIGQAYVQPPLQGEEELVPLRLFVKAQHPIDAAQLVRAMYRDKYGAVNGISNADLAYSLRKIGLAP